MTCCAGYWPRATPPFWKDGERQPQPWIWFRANILHTLCPADANSWQLMREPFAIATLIARLHSATSVLAFILLYVLLPKKDEYQMAHFILKFKKYQFISVGVISSISTAMGHFDCQWPGDPCHYHVTTTMRTLIFLEVFRIAAVWAAGYQIHSGKCSGGYEELMALEDVRLRTARTHCDEYGDPLDPHTNQPSGADSEKDEDFLHEESIVNRLEEARLKDVEEQRVQARRTSLARKKYHARQSHDTMLTYLLIYDAILLAIVLLNAILSNIIYQTWGEPHMWISLMYAKFLYGLGSFPFLIFNVPVLGNALHASKPTGFDKSGRLVPSLTSTQLKERETFLTDHDSQSTKPEHGGLPARVATFVRQSHESGSGWFTRFRAHMGS